MTRPDEADCTELLRTIALALEPQERSKDGTPYWQHTFEGLSPLRLWYVAGGLLRVNVDIDAADLIDAFWASLRWAVYWWRDDDGGARILVRALEDDGWRFLANSDVRPGESLRHAVVRVAGTALVRVLRGDAN